MLQIKNLLKDKYTRKEAKELIEFADNEISEWKKFKLELKKRTQ